MRLWVDVSTSAATSSVIGIKLSACAATYPPVMLPAGTISLYMETVPRKKELTRHNRFITRKLKKLGR